MASTKYWESQNGMIMCEEHAGRELSSLIAQSPKARSHWTPRGTYYKMSKTEVQEMTELVSTFREHLCEVCNHESRNA
jgi:hypothetical protein